METVDRAADPRFRFDYGIPYEDTDVTEDEVPDSRTHQFFAICRQTYLQEDLPQWISSADVAAAMLADEELTLPDDDDVFELSDVWDGCWHRVSEERRPITEAAASTPVVWDTANVPAGVYLLLGYTYHPTFNLWSPRAGGVVRVHDGGDPAAAGPAAAITTEKDWACVGDTLHVEGCISALPGTTMSAFMAINPAPILADTSWQAIPQLSQRPVEGEQFSFDWDVPDDAAVSSVIIRVDFEDPDGGRYTAYQYEPTVVLREEAAACADGSHCEGSVFLDPNCSSAETGDDSDGPDDADDPDATEDPDDPDAIDNPDAGAGCHVPGDSAWGWLALAWLGLAWKPRPRPSVPGARRRFSRGSRVPE